MRIGLDLDGVCYPYDVAFREYLVSNLGWDADICTPPTQWKFFLDWGLSSDEYWAHHINGINAGVIFNWGDPYPGVVAAVQAMKARGHEVHLVTDRNAGRPGVAMQSTAEWLARHKIPYDGIYFGGLKSVCSGLDAFVDDRPENVALMEGAGVSTWLLDRPYNQDACAARVPNLMNYLIEAESAA